MKASKVLGLSLSLLLVISQTGFCAKVSLKDKAKNENSELLRSRWENTIKSAPSDSSSWGFWAVGNVKSSQDSDEVLIASVANKRLNGLSNSQLNISKISTDADSIYQSIQSACTKMPAGPQACHLLALAGKVTLPKQKTLNAYIIHSQGLFKHRTFVALVDQTNSEVTLLGSGMSED